MTSPAASYRGAIEMFRLHSCHPSLYVSMVGTRMQRTEKKIRMPLLHYPLSIFT